MRESDKILERLLTLHPKIIDLSLDRMHDILTRLGNPERNLPPVIHVAGTNGKGSTIAYLRSILESANFSVHVYTSPHLVHFAERIRLGGTLITEEYLTELLDYCEKVNEGEPITYFEITTAAALKAFADNPADILILEVGLGGRLDATNVVDKPLSTIITPVSMDHEQFLGSNIRSIAIEKAGISKKNSPLLIAKQLSEARDALKEVARNKGAIICKDWSTSMDEDSSFIYEDAFGSFQIPQPGLTGPHQIDNATLAIAALRHQNKFSLSVEHFQAGVTNTKWPARMQNITESSFGKLLHKESELWLDGGHNPAASGIIAKNFEHKRLIVICGMMKNKDCAGYLSKISDITDMVIGVHVDGEDSYAATDIVKIAWTQNLQAETSNSVEHALQKITHAEPVNVLICGSLYLAGQVLTGIGLIPD